MFVCGFLGICIFLLCVNSVWDKGYQWIVTIIFGMVFASYIQGNFLPTSFGKMDGEAVDWNAFKTEGILSVILWGIVVIGSMLLLYFWGFQKSIKCCKIIMVCVLMVQGITLTTLCLTTDGLKSKDCAAFSDKNEFVYSSDKNIIVLVLDMFDSQVFQTICEDDENEKCRGGNRL